ncbi:hypothetical protein HID58_057981 [Brassica napus]|uniref:Protein kinase domain-containing protein n=2 Tax=Brassica TaxID=3705 RepID=A0ABQ7ZNQ2_BRANA|nr:hypothetical protein HID58_057981 [Brassica napus]
MQNRLRHFDHTCSGAKYELGKEVGRRHFGHTCSGLGKNGEIKDHPIAVNIISKVKVQISILMIILVEVIFGISIMISTLWSTRPDERLNDIVGSAYYVAPEILHRSYSLQTDI